VDDAQVQAVLRKYNSDPDGKLDLPEFSALVADIGSYQGRDAPSVGGISVRSVSEALRLSSAFSSLARQLNLTDATVEELRERLGLVRPDAAGPP
jgi:hypothetical protein